ncbi:hypothetical protein Syun_025589 [Stephania yunnanensis]|uniref:Uncharacterized protein n=1 Tax=Stephania yunnanensis TaxID=152371 RepID=A0AAP0F0U6_9MAGN
MTERLRNGAVLVYEYGTKQTFSVVVDSRAIPWLMKVVKEGVGAFQTKVNSEIKYWHEGMVTISLQKVYNERGTGGYPAKVSIEKVRIEDCGVDSTQIRELPRAFGAEERVTEEQTTGERDNELLMERA